MDSPIVYPALMIAGRNLTVKFDFLAQFKLDEMGVDTRQLGGLLRGSTGTVATLVKLFAASVAHNYVENREPIPTAEYWAMQIQIEKAKQPDIWQDICSCVSQAMVKVVPPSASPATVELREPGAKTN